MQTVANKPMLIKHTIVRSKDRQLSRQIVVRSHERQQISHLTSELGVSPLLVPVLIAAVHRGMARLSWPR